VTVAIQGYALVLPPGWRRIPVRSDSAPAIDRIVDEAFAAFSRDAAATRRRGLREALQAQVDRARRAGGLDLYIPVTPMHGHVIPASFLVAETHRGGTETEAVLAILAAENPGASVLTVDGAPAVRFEREVTAPLDADEPESLATSRRVEYSIAVPGDPGRWVTVGYSVLATVAPDAEITALLVDLFDAVMSTFRWRSEEAWDHPRPT